MPGHTGPDSLSVRPDVVIKMKNSYLPTLNQSRFIG